MSKRNKVNPGQYTQAGRLSPDDAARELRKTQSSPASDRTGSGQKSAAAGISNRESPEEEGAERERLQRDDAPSGSAPGNTENEQASGKSGSRSGAQKAADSKYVNRPHPASEKVEGAFGREPGDSSER